MEGAQFGQDDLDRDEFHSKVNAVVTRLVREGVRLTGTQRRTAELMTWLGYSGRSGGRISDSAISGWFTGRNPPTARELVGLVLYHGISVDEVIHGAGLTAQVGALDEEMQRLGREVRYLAQLLTTHLQGDSAPVEELERRADPGREAPD